MLGINNNSVQPPHQIMVGQHYPELDGIRGIAILLVLIFHCRIIAMPQGVTESIYFGLAETTWVGVDLFFVLSGFLITGILLDTYKQKLYFRNFYIRRILRIFPLYYAVIILVALVAQFGQIISFEQKSTIAQFSYWFYLQNWLTLFDLKSTNILGHFWSLAIEEQFYLIWPALVLFAARRSAVAKLCISIVPLAFIVRIIMVNQAAELVSLTQPAYFFTISRMDTLALGAYVAVLLRQYGTLTPLRPLVLILGAISAAGVIFITAIQQGFFGHDPIVLIYGLLPLAILFASFLVIALTSDEQGVLRLFLRNNWLRFIGTISYGVYIFHWPIIVLVKDVWPSMDNFWINQFGFITLVAVLSITIAWFSFQYFESPFLRLKNKLAAVQTSL